MTKAEYLDKLRMLQSNLEYIGQQITELRDDFQREVEDEETPQKNLEDYKGSVPIELINDFIEDTRRKLRIKDDIILVDGDRVRVLEVDTDAQDYKLTNHLGDSLNAMIVKVVKEYENFYV